MNKKILLIFLGIILLGSFGIAPVLGAEANYCCERLADTGAWCMNDVETNCDVNYKKAPTQCAHATFCELGTCINVGEGTCMENTPQRTCTDAGGFWKKEKPEDIAQCKLGCCLLGDQAAFVTQTRCKTLGAFYGLETNFRTDLNNEVSCISSAAPDIKGACVFEKEFEKTCRFSTRSECQAMEITVPDSILDSFNSQGDPVLKVQFYEKRLCSDEALGTVCGPSKKTTCVETRDEVYFLDTCGNLANVYDASKQGDARYWAEVQEPTCTVNSGNSNSCGNCDYFEGSTCKKSSGGDNPTYGDYICKDLSCKYEGVTYQHGETWCAESAGVSSITIKNNEVVRSNIDYTKENIPGSRYFRMVCYNGDVTVEPCADYRQEICVESDSNGFSTSACRVNRWETCAAQETEKDCINDDRRDCRWISSGAFRNDLSDDDKEDIKKDIEGGRTLHDKYFQFVCVPKYTPGFDFYNPETDASDMCSLASTQCVVNYEKKIGGDWSVITEDAGKCLDNKKNILPQWMQSRENLCMSLGDCGSKINYAGQQGYYSWEDDVFVKNNTK